MADNIKSKSSDMGGLQVNVDKLGLASTKAANAPDITLVGVVSAAGTGAGSAGAAGGAVATHVFTVEVGGTTYYVPLCNTNAS